MPHAKNGQEVKAGDVVVIRFKVRDVDAGAGYCNATLDTVEPMYPTGLTTCVALNAKQIEYVESDTPVKAFVLSERSAELLTRVLAREASGGG